MFPNLPMRHLALPDLSSLRLTFALMALALGLAACSSNKQSAPIEVRSPQQARPVARPEVARRDEVPAAGVATGPAVAPAPAAADKPAAAQGAQTGAVKQGSTESRPLTPPAGPAPATGAPAAVPPSAAAPALKSGPKGTKRPYSEAALAEMRQADAPASVTGPVANPAPAGDAKADPKSDSRADAKADAKSEGKADGKAGPVSFAWPSKGKVLAGFSEPRQMGLSIDGKIGDPVQAAADGKVIFSGVGPRGFGNLIIVKHDGELLSVYAHNKALLVKDGQAVKKGQKIAELGDSGTDKPQLHFEIRRQGKPVDPRPFLPPR